MSPFSSHLLSWASGLVALWVASSWTFYLFSISDCIHAIWESCAKPGSSNTVLRPMRESPEQHRRGTQAIAALLKKPPLISQVSQIHGW